MKARLVGFRLARSSCSSMTMVAYELAVMRSFAVGSWSNFGSMVDQHRPARLRPRGHPAHLPREPGRAEREPWLAWTAALLGPCHGPGPRRRAAAPLQSRHDHDGPDQFLARRATTRSTPIPFFVGAFSSGVSFIAFRSRIHRLYFWNMLGSGLGGFSSWPCPVRPAARRTRGALSPRSPRWRPCSASSTIAAETGVSRSPSGASLAAAGAFCVSLALLATFGDIRVSEFKPISYARNFPDSKLVYHSFGPTGEIDAFSSSFFHVAPGLSDNASSSIAAMPENAFLGLYIDGDGPVGIMRRLNSEESA